MAKFQWEDRADGTSLFDFRETEGAYAGTHIVVAKEPRGHERDIQIFAKDGRALRAYAANSRNQEVAKQFAMHIALDWAIQTARRDGTSQEIPLFSQMQRWVSLTNFDVFIAKTTAVMIRPDKLQWSVGNARDVLAEQFSFIGTLDPSLPRTRESIRAHALFEAGKFLEEAAKPLVEVGSFLVSDLAVRPTADAQAPVASMIQCRRSTAHGHHMSNVRCPYC